MFNLLTMTVNDAKFVESVVNFDKNIAEARQYILEKFGVKSDYNEEEQTIVLHPDSSLKGVAAKEYLNETLYDNIVDTIID